MSAMSEESPPPTNDPQDPLYYAPRRTGERAEPRLASINDTPLERASRAEPAPRPLPPSAALSARLESAVYESLRRQIGPEAIPEPIDFRRDSTRRTLIAIASGVAAALAVASVAALLFVTVYPKERDAGPSFASTVQPSQSQADDASKPALAQFRALVTGNTDGQNLTHEQSERLLQQFVQWQHKAASTNKP